MATIRVLVPCDTCPRFSRWAQAQLVPRARGGSRISFHCRFACSNQTSASAM